MDFIIFSDQYAYSDDRSIRHRAILCIRVLLDQDTYSRTQVLGALASTGFAQSAEYFRLKDTTGRRTYPSASLGGPRPPSRYHHREMVFHHDKQRNLLHALRYRLSSSGSLKPISKCTDACLYKRSVILYSPDVFEIIFCKTPIRVPTWATPILAGQTPEGHRKFIAEAYFESHYVNYCVVAEGIQPEGLLVYNRWEEAVVPDEIRLFVLRYSLDTYPNLVLVRPNGKCRMDTTGDLSDYAALTVHT